MLGRCQCPRCSKHNPDIPFPNAFSVLWESYHIASFSGYIVLLSERDINNSAKLFLRCGSHLSAKADTSTWLCPMSNTRLSRPRDARSLGLQNILQVLRSEEGFRPRIVTADYVHLEDLAVRIYCTLSTTPIPLRHSDSPQPTPISSLQ